MVITAHTRRARANALIGAGFASAPTSSKPFECGGEVAVIEWPIPLAKCQHAKAIVAIRKVLLKSPSRARSWGDACGPRGAEKPVRCSAALSLCDGRIPAVGKFLHLIFQS